MALVNGWKQTLVLATSVLAGVTVLVCGAGLTDWLDYSGLEANVASAQSDADAAMSEAKEAHNHSEENTERIACLETNVKIMVERSGRMESNLYEFLKAQPNMNPTPPAKEEEKP